MQHTRKKSFYRKPLSLSQKFVLDVGSTFLITQRESEKMIWEVDFE